jgi:hypothetical protein
VGKEREILEDEADAAFFGWDAPFGAAARDLDSAQPQPAGIGRFEAGERP